jgi:predicted PurR-regulated permease PerM
VTPSNSTASLRPIVTLGGLILVVGFLYWARAVLVPLALAMFLAFILAPAVNVLQRRGPGRVTSVLIVVVLAFGLLGGIGFFVGNQLAGLVRRLPDYREVITAKVKSLSTSEGTGLLNTVRKTVHEVNERVEEVKREPETVTGVTSIKDQTPGVTPDYPLYVRQTTADWSGFADYAGPAAEALASAVLVAVMVIFMLVQRENLRNRLVRLLGHGELIITTRAIDEGARRISKFLVMQLLMNAAFGAVLSIALVIISFFASMPEDRDTLRSYAILWGFICGLTRFVPYVGTWVGAAMLAAFTIATLHGWTLPLVVCIVFVAEELVCANVIEPLLFSHSTGSSPLALLLAAAFWAWLWGPVGLLLSTPLTVVLVVIGKYVPQLQFLEVLLGDEPVMPPHIVLYQRLIAKDQDEASDLIEDYVQHQSSEDAYEQLVLPALVLARQDLERGKLHGKNARELFQSLRELIDENAPDPVALPEQAPPENHLLGCPARDEIDELALSMLNHMLRAQGRSLEIISSATLTGEVLTKTAETCPAVVIVASVAPGGLAQARYLCKRLRTQCPGLKVLVERCGPSDNLERERDRLKSAGADFVSSKLSEIRVEAVSHHQVAEASPARPPRAAVELSTTN